MEDDWRRSVKASFKRDDLPKRRISLGIAVGVVVVTLSLVVAAMIASALRPDLF
jgi:uncharacterized membrane protein YidH (DUF202 family)